MNASNLDRRIDALKPGQSITISEHNGIHCTAERSGDGKRVRFVRHTPDGGFVVFRETGFSAR